MFTSDIEGLRSNIARAGERDLALDLKPDGSAAAAHRLPDRLCCPLIFHRTDRQPEIAMTSAIRLIAASPAREAIEGVAPHFSFLVEIAAGRAGHR